MPKVLKYQSPKPMKNGSLPEPIFFQPNNHYPDDGHARLIEERPKGKEYYMCELFRSDPFTDSWHLLHNPEKRKNFPGMPMASRYNAYNDMYVTVASNEEAQAYLKLRYGT